MFEKLCWLFLMDFWWKGGTFRSHSKLWKVILLCDSSHSVHKESGVLLLSLFRNKMMEVNNQNRIISNRIKYRYIFFNLVETLQNMINWYIYNTNTIQMAGFEAIYRGDVSPQHRHIYLCFYFLSKKSLLLLHSFRL